MQVFSAESVYIVVVRGLKVSMLRILNASCPRIKGAVEMSCVFGIRSGQNSNSPNESPLHFLSTGLFVCATKDKMLFQYWFLVPDTLRHSL